MAQMLYSNFDNNNSNAGGFTDYNADMHIVKEDLKKTWFLFRTSNGSVVKPYAVYDHNGEPSPARNEHEVAMLSAAPPTETTNEQGEVKYVRPNFEVLSDAFVLIRLATFAGVSGKLAFVDWCSDMPSYCPPGVEAIQTPYHYLIKALKTLLPDKNGKIKAGGVTPNELRKMQKNVNYSAPSILFRGAVIRHNGKPSNAKSAIDGILFKTLFYVPHSSACKALCLKMAGKRDPKMPTGPGNNPVSDLFDIDGVNFSFHKMGAEITADYGCDIDYDSTFAKSAMTAFGLQDPSQYHQAVRAMFGPYQNIGDMLNILTVAQMVDLLKKHFPISWVWFGLKDSPYAGLISPQEKDMAFRDPEMAPYFGLQSMQSAPGFNNIPQYNNAASGYNSTPQYGAAESMPKVASMMQDAQVSYTPKAAAAPQPTYTPPVMPQQGTIPPMYAQDEPQAAPAFNPGMPQPQSLDANAVSAAIEERFKKWGANYGGEMSDGIKY